jgi:hypothetical protein
MAATVRHQGDIDWKHAVLTPMHLHIHHPAENLTIPWNDYLPGYVLDNPVLCAGNSFEMLQFNGPQEIYLRLSGPAIELADAATLVINQVTSHTGWAVNAGDCQDEDFSFSARGYTNTTTVPINDGVASIPIHCKDYGAWAEIHITLKKGGTAIHPEAITVTLPHDANGDRIADKWQHREVLRWNAQYRQHPGDSDWINPDNTSTWAAIFGSNGEADAELADSDGPTGPMPPMADDGDGLTAMEEYRGFFLDGGPGVAHPQHRRLSVARKELLVECSVMEGISSTVGSLAIPDSEFEDEGNDANVFAQVFDLDSSMAMVADFFAKEVTAGQHDGSEYFMGAAMDMWWVKDKLNDGANDLVLENGAAVSNYKYSGPYHDLQSNSDRNGWLSIYYNAELLNVDEELHDERYGEIRNGIGIMGNLSNRNQDCRQFIKVVFQGRKAQRNTFGNYIAMKNQAAREADEALEKSSKHQGAAIFVNSLSEESHAGQPWTNLEAFKSRLDFSIAHELAHLFVIGRNRNPQPSGGVIAIHPFDPGEHIIIEGANNLMSNYSSMNVIRFHEEEIQKTNLRLRASIHRIEDEEPEP